MKIRSSNWNQKQIVDINEPINHAEWIVARPKTPLKTYSIAGVNYRVADKRVRHLPLLSLERIKGIALGIFLTVCSLGTAPFFSKTVRQLFTGRQVMKIVDIAPQIDGGPRTNHGGGNGPLPVPPANVNAQVRENPRFPNLVRDLDGWIERAKLQGYAYTDRQKQAILQAAAESNDSNQFAIKMGPLVRNNIIDQNWVRHLNAQVAKYTNAAQIQGPQNPAKSTEATFVKFVGNQVDDLYRDLPIRRDNSDYRMTSDRIAQGGAVNVGREIVERNPHAKVGVMIAANSGLPGGALGKRPGAVTPADLTISTQEENIWANAVLTACGTNSARQLQFNRETIGGKWGMVDGPVGNSRMTKQGIDFTQTVDPEDYNGVFVVKDAALSQITARDAQGFKRLVPNTAYPVVFAFADSINANESSGTPTGTMMRTLNYRAVNDYEFFRECVKTKLRSALDAMASEGVTDVLVAQLSCGIYAGNHKARINSEFYPILQEVLEEEVGPDGEERGRFFSDVVVPTI